MPALSLPENSKSGANLQQIPNRVLTYPRRTPLSTPASNYQQKNKAYQPAWS